MPKFLKHVGLDTKGDKCVVVFREIPGDSDSALIVLTEKLPTLFHDDLIKTIESATAQESMDVSDYLFRQRFHDGTNMLNTMHQNGWLVKVPCKSVVMTPQVDVKINLAELNGQLRLINTAPREANAIAQENNPPGVLSDSQIATKLRAQANTFEVEARRLREEAEKLDPKGQQKSVVNLVPEESTKRSRGRPAKEKTVA